MTPSNGHTIRSGSQGSSRSLSSSVVTSDRGLTNRTPAQIPSPPRAPTPSRCDSRWVSQRSTPRAGTTTSSWSKHAGRRLREQIRKAVREQVGALGAVDLQAHECSMSSTADSPLAAPSRELWTSGPFRRRVDSQFSTIRGEGPGQARTRALVGSYIGRSETSAG